MGCRFMREMLIYSVPRSIKADCDDATTRELNEEQEERDPVKTWVRKGTRLISLKKDRESLLITSAPSWRSRGSWLDQAKAGTKLSVRNRNTLPNSLVKHSTGRVLLVERSAMRSFLDRCLHFLRRLELNFHTTCCSNGPAWVFMSASRLANTSNISSNI